MGHAHSRERLDRLEQAHPSMSFLESSDRVECVGSGGDGLGEGETIGAGGTPAPGTIGLMVCEIRLLDEVDQGVGQRSMCL